MAQLNQRQIIVFNGEVESDDLMDNIPEGFDGDIIINGCLKLFGDVKANASILIFGNVLDFCDTSNIEVVGDLICTGDNWCSGNITAHGICYCGGDIYYAGKIKAEDLECDGEVHAVNITAVDVNVKGFIEALRITYHNELNCHDIHDAEVLKE